MLSQFLRCSAALGGPASGFTQGRPDKVRARKSVLFTEGSPVVEIKNTVDFVAMLSNPDNVLV